MGKKIVLWLVGSTVAVAGVLTLLTFTYFWRSPGCYPDPAAAPGIEDRIVGQAEYSDDHRNPYVFRSGDVVVFGAAHTRDPADPQIGAIDRAWAELDPTVALVEGRLGFLAPGFMDPVEHYGESGHVVARAKDDDCDVYSGDMPESFVEEFLGRAADPAVAGAIDDVADIDRIWTRDFPDGPDWRDVSDEHGLPGYLQEVSDASNDLRNRHLVRTALDLAGRGERVFVVAGSSHAVLTRDAFTAAATGRRP